MTLNRSSSAEVERKLRLRGSPLVREARPGQAACRLSLSDKDGSHNLTPRGGEYG